ncbi:unnamed protein product [Allacma fusca]|uniref:Uncharacterized protein n=1 Tax=Allacma fusca TaxID=39272 RepID=A0A8J2PR58_9HEXA|nr:unnamed protein product [Allacma fusca]
MTKTRGKTKLMTLYHKYVEAHVGAHTPRIIGLTATINKKKIKDITVGHIAMEVKTLEDKLAAEAVSFEDIDEVRRFSTASTVRTVEYSPIARSEWEGLFDGIKTLHTFIQSQKKMSSVSDIERLALAFKLPSFSISSSFTSRNGDVKKELNKLILDFEEMYNNIGPLCCAEVVGYKLEWLLQFQSKVTGYQQAAQYDVLNIQALMTQLHCFHAKLSQRLGTNNGKQDLATLKKFLSHKMDTLLNLLKAYSEKEGQDDQLLGLVFVKRRSYASGIKSILELMADADPISYGFIKAELITGTNNIKKDAANLRVSIGNQKKIIELFRRRHINLIICTTVLEEGTDVPSCNLVVRFDEIYAYTSFIQSMGRARKSGAQFVALISSAEKRTAEKKLSDFMKQSRTIDIVLKSQKDSKHTMLPNDLLDDNPDPGLEINDFAPFGFGPKVVATSAIALVHRYVQKEAGRQILSWWNFETPLPNKPNHQFSASVWIRGSLLLPSVIKGPLMTSTQDAKKAVFMEVCRLLFEAGALDENLLPL